MSDVSDEIKAEVAEAVRILREDGHAIRLTAIEDRLKKHFPDEPETDPADPPADPDAPKPPPAVDPKPPASQRQSKSRLSWWPPDEEPSNET